MFRGRRKTLAQYRAQSKGSAHLLRIPRDVMVVDADIDGMHGLWIRPDDADTKKVILHLHGGGYVTGDSDPYRMMCVPMASTLKMHVLIPDYRLAPEHPFPAALEDAQRTYRWLLAQGYTPQDVIISGDSAGGGLSIAMIVALRDDGQPLPAAVVCISPWTDLTLSGRSHITNQDSEVMLQTDTLREWAAYYTDESNRSNPLVSPAFADLTGFPPLLIQVGSKEILLDDARLLAEKSRAVGVDVTLSVYDELWHVWQMLGELIPESRKAFEEMRAFLGTKT